MTWDSVHSEGPHGAVEAVITSTRIKETDTMRIARLCLPSRLAVSTR